MFHYAVTKVVNTVLKCATQYGLNYIAMSQAKRMLPAGVHVAKKASVYCASAVVACMVGDKTEEYIQDTLQKAEKEIVGDVKTKYKETNSIK